MAILEIFAENKMLLIFIGLAIFYLGYRLFYSTRKAGNPYQENLDKIMNSDEYKVKGRFE